MMLHFLQDNKIVNQKILLRLIAHLSKNRHNNLSLHVSVKFLVNLTMLFKSLNRKLPFFQILIVISYQIKENQKHLIMIVKKK